MAFVFVVAMSWIGLFWFSFVYGYGVHLIYLFLVAFSRVETALKN